jgi:hypothetical protein
MCNGHYDMECRNPETKDGKARIHPYILALLNSKSPYQYVTTIYKVIWHLFVINKLFFMLLAKDDCRKVNVHVLNNPIAGVEGLVDAINQLTQM